MADYVTDTQALVKFMMGKKVIRDPVRENPGIVKGRDPLRCYMGSDGNRG